MPGAASVGGLFRYTSISNCWPKIRLTCFSYANLFQCGRAGEEREAACVGGLFFLLGIADV